MADYIPPSLGWVKKQVELYESSGGTKGTTLLETGMPCIIVTHVGNKTGGIRKIPLMRVKVEESYVLVGSMGGQPKNPVWVYNLRANPEVEIRDETEVTNMRVREVTEDSERDAIWKASAEA
jgi:deazaflavin-dependent oxidoreductase (nitroreductase family)